MRLRALFAVLFLLSTLPFFAFAQTTTEQRAALQAQLDRIEQEIANNQGTLSDLTKQRTTLERDIGILDKKIKAAQLQIKASDITLKQLQGNISEKQSAIVQVDGKVERTKDSLAQLLRETRQVDDIPLALLVLSGSLSDIFTDLDNFQSLQRSIDTSFAEMAALRSDLNSRKTELEDKQDEAEKVRQVQVLAKQAVQNDEKQKKSILTVTKGQEKTYQQIIADKQKQAASIRAALFGLRDSGAIPFGTAYDYAKAASASTGVRPALILAILTQESDLGSNVGSCYVTNITTGSGVGKNTGKVFANVMKAPRDTVPFQQITQAVGRDWPTTPVSCPQASGYGGAMGPAQFIPSTWVLFKNRLSGITGESYPDPWNGRTAVFATALLMKDNGADGGTRESERKAALKYFAGGNWNKAAYAFYGTQVMSHADDIQAEIDILNQ